MTTFMLPDIIYILIRKKRRITEKKKLYIFGGIIFATYCYLAIVRVAGIGTIWDFVARGFLSPTINLELFASDGLLPYILNIIMFMPLGFLLPLIWSEYRKLWQTVLVGFGMSFLIEILQMFSNRATDIDDLMMNTLGAVVGYTIWKCFEKILVHSNKSVCGFPGNDSIIMILLGCFCTFFLYNWRLFY